MIINNPHYRSIVLSLLKHGNKIFVVMIVAVIYVSFLPNLWPYIGLLTVSTAYLVWLTAQYLMIEDDDCEGDCDLQYGCQIASFNSRLSVLSNLSISLFASGFGILLIKNVLYPDPRLAVHSHAIDMHYVVSFFKLILMYILSDKIHTSQMLLSVLYRYSQTIRFLHVDVDPTNPTLRFPEIYIDDAKISISRYQVIDHDGSIDVFFTPALSISPDSRLEYELIEPDHDHVIILDPDDENYIAPACMFRCHIAVRNRKNMSQNK